MDYKNMQDSMVAKFSKTNKIKVFQNTPNQKQICELEENKIIKTPLLAIAVNIVNFENLKKHSNLKILNLLISEFKLNINKLMKEYGTIKINIQSDRIFGIMKNAGKRKDIDHIFALACEINTFRNHIKNNIDKYFSNKDLKTSNYSYNFEKTSENFDFGIGIWLSDENYIIKSSYVNDFIFMGDSIDMANNMAKFASRNHRDPIYMNNYLYENFTHIQKSIIIDGGGFISNYDPKMNLTLWSCSWINTKYNNFVNNIFDN